MKTAIMAGRDSVEPVSSVAPRSVALPKCELDGDWWPLNETRPMRLDSRITDYDSRFLICGR
jgi:hypothetical protein